MGVDWHADDDTPYEEWLAKLEAKYGKRIARVIAGAPPPARKTMHRAVNPATGRRTVAIRGNAENPDAAPSAVDFRHHRARIERGK